MKLPMNVDIYSIGFVFETIWRWIVGGATGTRASNQKWPLGGLSNFFIFISGMRKSVRPYQLCHGGIVFVCPGLITCFSVFHQSFGPEFCFCNLSVNLSITFF